MDGEGVSVKLQSRRSLGASSSAACVSTGQVGAGCLALERPIIRLADNAPKFGSCGSGTTGGSGGSRPVVDFTMSTSEQHPTSVSGVNFNQLFKGIDVVIGKGTPAAAGVQLPGAQGSSIQDTTITVGSGYAGVVGGAGAGGSHEMVTVLGGRVGMDYTATLNCPTITGATLLNQTVAAIIYDGLEAASVVGTTIQLAAGAVALKVTSGSGSKWGEVSIVDSTVSAAQGTTAPAAFDTNRSLYLRNVYLKGFDTVCDSAPTTPAFKLNPESGWNLANELSLGRPIPGTAGESCPAGMVMSIFINGKQTTQPWLANISTTGVLAPPRTYGTQHSWDEPSFPSMDMPGVVDVRTMGAVGNGLHDDTAVIQKVRRCLCLVFQLPS